MLFAARASRAAADERKGGANEGKSGSIGKRKRDRDQDDDDDEESRDPRNYELDNGLGVEEHEVGRGRTPESGELVTVKYSAEVADGNRLGGGMLSFRLGSGHMVQGFDQGVMLMRQGAHSTLTVPPEIGYGEKGSMDDSGNGVPPNATVIFDVKLVRIGTRKRGNEASSDDDDDDETFMPKPSAYRNRELSSIGTAGKKEGKGSKRGKRGGKGKGGKGGKGGRGVVDF